MKIEKKSHSYQGSDYRKYKTEAELTRVVKSWLELQRDVKFDKISDRYKKGISDFICCVGGTYVALELKDDTGIPSIHQLKFIEKIRQAGGVAGVCDCLYDVKKLVQEARERKFKN